MALAPRAAYSAGRLLCSRVARPLRRQEDGQSLSPLSSLIHLVGPETQGLTDDFTIVSCLDDDDDYHRH
jgi:hypothetical protein